ncbi:MAG TPA: cellulase family glycosylhydrolase [Candidatus Binatia bacterium]|nr:cellulase family glycosylhydrolase [Candidatus Binatia bacterium]
MLIIISVVTLLSSLTPLSSGSTSSSVALSYSGTVVMNDPPTPTPSPTPTATPTPTPTAPPTPIPHPTPTATPTPTPSPSPTPTPQPTSTPTPTPKPTPTATPTPSPTPTATPTPSPTTTPTPTPSPTPTPTPGQTTVVSTELINYYSFTDSDVNTFITKLHDQGISEVTIRFNAYNEYTSESPPASAITVAKKIVSAASAVGIAVNVDSHSWYTTLQNEIFPSTVAQDHYVAYVENVVRAMDIPGVKAFMVMNEPPALTASTANNNFILRVIAAAKALTTKPISVRFMAGYSPTTGHYSPAIDAACDFISRNTYWDPRNPTVSVYGTTETKLLAAVNSAHSQGKEIWITEFGKVNSNVNEQANYVRAFVQYAKTNSMDRIFCWVSQPKGSGETYNIWNGLSPNPAFYELVN